MLDHQGTSSLTLGDDLTLIADKVVANSVGLFLYGRSESSTPFAGGTLCVAPPLWRTPAQSTGVGADLCTANGAAVSTLTQTISKGDLAAIGWTPGDSFVVQAWYRDPGFSPPDDVGLSNALRFFLWP